MSKTITLATALRGLLRQIESCDGTAQIDTTEAEAALKATQRTKTKPADRERLVGNLHAAVRAYIEGNGGNLSVVGPVEIVAHKPLSFDLVIHCVGQFATRTPER